MLSENSIALNTIYQGFNTNYYVMLPDLIRAKITLLYWKIQPYDVGIQSRQ